MRRLTLLSLLTGVAIALLIAVTGAGRAAAVGTPALGADTSTLGSAVNPDGTSGVPVNTVLPTLSRQGTVKVGARLSCATGIWADDPTGFRVRWRRGRTLVHTGATYTVRRADRKHTLACYVSASNPQGAGTAVLAGVVRVAG